MAVALWFCPAYGSTAYESLNQLIISLQSLFPASPLFEPHITITSDLNCTREDDVNKILTSCVASIQSIKPYLLNNERSGSNGSQSHHSLPLVSFNGCTINKPYFKKVVLECEPNRFLYSIAQIMRELYVEQSKENPTESATNWLHNDFKPHVSLLYSDNYSISSAFARTIQQRIEDTLDIQFVKNDKKVTGDVQNYWQFNDIPIQSWGIPGTFKIVKCEGPVEEWKVLGRATV